MVENYAQGNATIYDTDVNVLVNALAGFGIISGCSISKGAGDWEIDVTAGTVFITGTGEVSVSANGPTLSDSSGLTSGQSRIDLITADTGGTLAAVEGNAATNPDAPDIPSDEVVLGYVVIAESDSTLADSDIRDTPALLGDDHVRYHDGGSHEIDAADLGASSGSANQFLKNTDGSAASWSGTLVATGTYTGDGATSQGITGVGFQPVYVMITERETGDATDVEIHETTTVIVDDNASGGALRTFGGGAGVHFETDHILSLDSDGFTVDDDGADADPNTNGATYNYLAIG